MPGKTNRLNKKLEAFHDALIDEVAYDAEQLTLDLRLRCTWPHQPSTVFGSIRLKLKGPLAPEVIRQLSKANGLFNVWSDGEALGFEILATQALLIEYASIEVDV